MHASPNGARFDSPGRQPWVGRHNKAKSPNGARFPEVANDDPNSRTAHQKHACAGFQNDVGISPSRSIDYARHRQTDKTGLANPRGDLKNSFQISTFRPRGRRWPGTAPTVEPRKWSPIPRSRPGFSIHWEFRRFPAKNDCFHPSAALKS